LIAQRVGCNRDTIAKYIRIYPDVKRAYDQECETVFDIVESELLKKIKKGDITALIFYAKTKMKARGYVERIQGEVVDPLETAKKIRRFQRALRDSVPQNPPKNRIEDPEESGPK